MAPSLASVLLPLLILLGAVPDGWLGVYLAETGHPQISEVVPDSPADRAGLRAGDRILAVGDEAVPDREKFIAAIRACKPGQRVRLKVQRQGSEMTLLVQLGERPDGAGAPAPAATAPERPVEAGGRGQAPAGETGPFRPFLGLALAIGEGCLEVTRVVPGGPCEAAGLRAGERVVRVGDHDVRSFGDLERALAGRRPGEKVALLLRAGDGTRSVLVELGAGPASPSMVLEAPTAPAHGAAPGAGEADLARQLAAMRAELAALKAELAALKARLAEERRRR